jgi:peroxiredoxin
MEMNQLAPDFTLPDLEGHIHMLSDYRGRLVIVNFWSAECPHSQRVDNFLQAYRAEWGEAVVILSIASNGNESQEMISRIARNRNLQVVLRDAEQAVAERYEALATPHVYLIDRQGVLRYRGAVDDVSFRQREPSRYYLKEAVDALLSGRLPDPLETQPFGCTIVRHL